MLINSSFSVEFDLDCISESLKNFFFSTNEQWIISKIVPLWEPTVLLDYKI